MIIDAILGILGFIIGGFFDLVIGLMPAPPDWLITGITECWDLIDEAHVMDTWLPVDLGLTVIGGVLAAYAASVTIGIVRLIVSYFTLGSGAT